MLDPPCKPGAKLQSSFKKQWCSGRSKDDVSKKMEATISNMKVRQEARVSQVMKKDPNIKEEIKELDDEIGELSKDPWMKNMKDGMDSIPTYKELEKRLAALVDDNVKGKSSQKSLERRLAALSDDVETEKSLDDRFQLLFGMSAANDLNIELLGSAKQTVSVIGIR